MVHSAAVPVSATKLVAHDDESRLRDAQAVDRRPCVEKAAAMDGHGRDLQVVGAADVLPADPAELNAVQAGYQRRKVVVAPAGWQGGDDLVAHDVLPLCALQVNSWRVTSYDNSLSKRTDRHLCIHGDDARASQLEVLAAESREPG